MNRKLLSVNNKKVKEFYQLTLKSKHRKSSNSFLIEGLREIRLALNNNFEIIWLTYHKVFYKELKRLNFKKIYF